MGNGQRAVRKNVADLADAGHLHARLRNRVEQRAAGRLQRKIMPSRRAVERAGRARKGTRNYASDGVLALQQTARRAAVAVKRFDGDDVLVRRHLKHAVGRGVNDVFAGSHMLLAVVADDLGARVGTVAEHAASDGGRKSLQQRLRKAVGKGGEGVRGNKPRQLPVAGGRVLAAGLLAQHRAAALRAAGERIPQRRQRKQPGLPQMRAVQKPALQQRVQRARACVAVIGGVRRRAGAERVQYRQKYAFVHRRAVLS